MAAYVEGIEGRLMRSMKSILGSPLIEQTTDVGGGRGAKYSDIVAGYLKRLRRLAGERLTHQEIANRIGMWWRKGDWHDENGNLIAVVTVY
mgnify:CR=1 FL=1